jgi:hypothetical protein
MRMMEVIDKAEFEPWMIGILGPMLAKLLEAAPGKVKGRCKPSTDRPPSRLAACGEP